MADSYVAAKKRGGWCVKGKGEKKGDGVNIVVGGFQKAGGRA